ncbi:hypothetical protein SRABI83_02346 [Arthrobacter sp. Bi83]|nr:hypothetical protein SRABI83_02346 [Arthrobacter sp. Bi83]
MQTTHGYVTVFQEHVIRHYQTHLAGPRAARAAREYRTPTKTEWAEFEEHFDKRKVELGNCGRPYATPCEHEHSCIRCPLLQVDPGMIGRLDEINTNLIAQRELAHTKGWLDELKGIDLTLRFLHDKRADAQRLARLIWASRSSVLEGVPLVHPWARWSLFRIRAATMSPERAVRPATTATAAAMP